MTKSVQTGAHDWSATAEGTKTSGIRAPLKRPNSYAETSRKKGYDRAADSEAIDSMSLGERTDATVGENDPAGDSAGCDSVTLGETTDASVGDKDKDCCGRTKSLCSTPNGSVSNLEIRQDKGNRKKRKLVPATKPAVNAQEIKKSREKNVIGGPRTKTEEGSGNTAFQR